MTPSMRFLAVVLVGWVGARAMMPDARLFTIVPKERQAPPPIVATQFPSIEPMLAETSDYPASGVQPWLMPTQIQPVVAPLLYASGPPPSYSPEWAATPANAALQFDPPNPALDRWPIASLAAISLPPTRSVSVSVPAQSRPAIAPSDRLDRVQLTTWALLRGQQGMALGTPSLSGRGSLGGSQAGARLSYNFTRQIAASLRTSSDVGRRGAEVAAGVRVQPLSSLPVWVTAERRQRIGDGTGRDAFALFAEGGIYQRPMPWDFDLDAYLQAGVVGLRSRDAFIDGGFTMTRPLYRQFAAGFGFWGAAQPGVYRVDAGPRVTMKVRDNLRIHFDWRQRLTGNAAPGSGPAITLTGDF